jgi:hypothetical protein
MPYERLGTNASTIVANRSVGGKFSQDYSHTARSTAPAFSDCGDYGSKRCFPLVTLVLLSSKTLFAPAGVRDAQRDHYFAVQTAANICL